MGGFQSSIVLVLVRVEEVWMPNLNLFWLQK